MLVVLVPMLLKFNLWYLNNRKNVYNINYKEINGSQEKKNC